MTYTRTYTVYFNDDDLAPLRREFEALVNDWQARSVHIDERAAEAGRNRLRMLSLAIDLLTERVP